MLWLNILGGVRVSVRGLRGVGVRALVISKVIKSKHLSPLNPANLVLKCARRPPG